MTAKTKKPTTIAEALLLAQRAMKGGVPKDGTNDHHRYDYVSAEAMIARCREVLLEVGLVLTAGDVELKHPVLEGVVAEITYRLYLVGAEGQYSVFTRAWPAVPGKGRPLDKAVASAQTACLSYALRDLLLIPRGDEAGVGMDDTGRDTGTTARQWAESSPTPSTRASTGQRASKASQGPFTGEAEPECPACGSRVWDNRDTATAENRRPSWKCANKKCTGGRRGDEWASWKADEFAAPPPPHVVPVHQPAPEANERGEDPIAEHDLPF